MHELVVTEPFGHGGHIYGRGEVISDSSLFADIEAQHPNKTVRRSVTRAGPQAAKQEA